MILRITLNACRWGWRDNGVIASSVIELLEAGFSSHPSNTLWREVSDNGCEDVLSLVESSSVTLSIAAVFFNFNSSISSFALSKSATSS